MTNLIEAEAVRFISRRLFRGLGILVVGVMLFAAVLTFVHSSKDPNSGLAQARAEVVLCHQAVERSVKAGNPNFGCPTLQDLRQQYDRRFRYTTSMPDIVRGVGGAMLFLSLLIGASFMGAEWGTGSMTTLLTWEPRRWRVLVSKWTACVAIVVVSVVVALAFLTLLFYPVGALRGITRGVTGHWWKDVSLTWLRAGALGAIGSTIGIALATISRNTAGAAGVGFVYGGILDQLLGVLFRGRFLIWTLHRNIAQFLGLPIEQPASSSQFGSGPLAIRPHFTAVRPAIVLSLYALGALGAAYVYFRRRDVT